MVRWAGRRPDPAQPTCARPHARSEAALKPRARTQGLVVRSLPREILVYDSVSHTAHCLNQTAALVFRMADGESTVDQLATELAAKSASPVDASALSLALEQLAAAGLLEPRPDAAPAAVDDVAQSRREIVRRLGVGAAVLVPAVTSILVPTPAEAANTCIPAVSCSGNTQQPCYEESPELECPTRKCTGGGICS